MIVGLVLILGTWVLACLLAAALVRLGFDGMFTLVFVLCVGVSGSILAQVIA
jgi:hypothetical protein